MASDSRKVIVHLRATGDAPILKQAKFKMMNQKSLRISTGGGLMELVISGDVGFQHKWILHLGAAGSLN
ncbi:hypothetical protein H5410_062725 [Solanum commersonii]|uniref:Uncharacterized protein n=1 Tax=Solanum commersonii TaxID=4109 RepID=A0A9J5WCB6_SOLCO|nr:hypothetical protein H5410_062725 [Solanum commersonii]